MGIVVYILFSTVIVQSEAIRCSVCTHSYSSKECISQGVKQCGYNENMCASVQRPDNGRMVYIKQCKSTVACKNNPNDHKKEVCCCKGDMCNFNHDECNGAPPPTCNVTMATLENGKLRCMVTNREGGAKIGSMCRFSCDAGFTRRGPLYTKCIREDSGEVKFNLESDKFPTCVPNKILGKVQNDPIVTEPSILNLPKLCRPEYIPYGVTVCMTAKAKILKERKKLPITAKCVYRCCRGHTLVGADEAICVFDKRKGAFLNNPAPKCVKRKGLKINRQIQY